MAQEQNISQDLYDLLVSQNLDPETKDESGNDTQANEASALKFDWKSTAGRNYGTAVVLITDEGELILFFGDNLGRGMEEPDKTEWYSFMQMLKNFATRNNLKTFDSQNISKLKHTMAGMAAIKEGLFEGYYGTRKISYMGEETDARLMIRHRKTLAETDKRHLNVESLFIETAEGERFKLPFTHLAGGRAMLEHVRQGGRPYDVRGAHITEMVSELKVLSRFNRASANRVLEGVTQQLVEQAQQYYKNLRETLKSMSRSRGYQTYFETWTPLTETESESLVEDIKTLFVEQTLDARIEAALPVLAKIKETQMREADIFESFINNLAEGTWAVPDTPEAERKLQELMAQELPVGPDATNVTEQLYDILGDDELYDQLEALARENPDADARPLIQARLEEMGFDIGAADKDKLDEIDRRGFLKGLGSVAAGAALAKVPGQAQAKDEYGWTGDPNDWKGRARWIQAGRPGLDNNPARRSYPEASFDRNNNTISYQGRNYRVQNVRSPDQISGAQTVAIPLAQLGQRSSSSRLYNLTPDGKAYSTSQTVRESHDPTYVVDDNVREADNLSTFEGSGCNHTMEGESCPEHGLQECGMYEGRSMVCKHCGDVFGKPTNSSCPYPCDDPDGGNWQPGPKHGVAESSDPLDRIKNLALAKIR